ncbi:MAG: DUF4118 domain-containing protein [Anaerolineae bacterium]
MSQSLKREVRSIVLGYLAALGLVILTTVALFLVRSLLTEQIDALVYLVPVGLSAAMWGLGPGVMAAFAAFLAFNYYFLQPYFTFFVHQTPDALTLLAFLVIAFVISQLIGRARLGVAAAQAREREATRLYELSTALTGVQHDQAIAHTLAQHAQETFEAERVDVQTQDAIDAAWPIEPAEPSRPPVLTIDLSTARGVQGTIRLWRDHDLLPAEVRLLKTFASQGALAIERAHLARTVNKAQVLEESDRLKSALLSSVSHELRTPLATIKAAASSLRSGDVEWDSDARQDLVMAIDEEADHLNQLVGNLLDMSRIEAGALQPQLKLNVLAEIVGGVVARMRPQTRQHRVDIDLPDDLPLVPVDYVRMDQVFTNLISNSVKYSPAGTPIRIEARVIDANTLGVRVINRGPHVPDEHLERIFDKFYRVTAADRVTGTGLGLSICKGIIEAHGGRMWAQNLPDGFAFNFTLPLKAAGTAANMPPHLPIESEGGA